MTTFLRLSFLFLLILTSCQNKESDAVAISDNQIKYASGLSIQKFEGFSIMTIKNPWPNAANSYTYILRKKNATIPDSLLSYEVVNVPIKSIIVTSTTHIPSLEMLDKGNSLMGFPSLQYISSPAIRSMIDGGKIREVGNNQSLNTEVIIDLNPDVVIGFGIDNNNPTFDNLKKSGLKVLFNGDWNEQTPLGKAEWIKFFGALYGLEDKAAEVFSKIESDYNSSLELVKNVSSKPSVMAGAIYENQWYLPQGESWGSKLLSEAGGNYLWSTTKGTGSLSLPFEKVLETAVNADVWIGPAQFGSLKEMTDNNAHYKEFKSFKEGRVYSYSSKKGATGGVIYYELAPNRPDLVLKDLIKILHPNLLPSHELFFFEQLK